MTGAQAANALFVATILLYAAAMFAYAVEYAFDKRARISESTWEATLSE